MRRKARHTSRRYKREDEILAFSAPVFIGSRSQPEAEMLSSNDLMQSPSNDAPETFNSPNLGNAEQAAVNAEQAGAGAGQNLEADLSSRERHFEPNRRRGNGPAAGASMSVVAEISGYESERVFVADTSRGLRPRKV